MYRTNHEELVPSSRSGALGYEPFNAFDALYGPLPLPLLAALGVAGAVDERVLPANCHEGIVGRAMGVGAGEPDVDVEDGPSVKSNDFRLASSVRNSAMLCVCASRVLSIICTRAHGQPLDAQRSWDAYLRQQLLYCVDLKPDLSELVLCLAFHNTQLPDGVLNVICRAFDICALRLSRFARRRALRLHIRNQCGDCIELRGQRVTIRFVCCCCRRLHVRPEVFLHATPRDR